MDLSMAKGTRDFPPEEKIVRDKIVNTLKKVFELYGYNPIETPTIERFETLGAKFAAGQESDALRETFQLIDQGGRKLGLRYDLTVPFCRYIGLNPKIKMPFKKYIVGQVFRDGPIKTGRYREFTQIDPDIVGCKSVIADAEILSIVSRAFKELGLDVYIELNDRKILDGILNQLGFNEEDHFRVLVIIDKLKKYGTKQAVKELEEIGIDKKKIGKLLSFFLQEKSSKETVERLRKNIKDKKGIEGLDEIEELLSYLEIMGVKDVNFNPALARGLAYYTGPVYEVFLKDSEIISSLAGGGRYDRLISNYLDSKTGIPATGISFGLEVIIEAIRKKGGFSKKSVARAFIIPVGETIKECLKLANELRDSGVNIDVDLLKRGISKNLNYANSYGIPFVIFVGEDEIKAKKFKLKDMEKGTENFFSNEELKKILK